MMADEFIEENSTFDSEISLKFKNPITENVFCHQIDGKLYPFEAACRQRQRLKTNGKRVVLTNGCFDLLHPGHVYFLQTAAKFGNSLWVALNGDQSVRKLKGPTRPIFAETIRAYVLGALKCMDGIFIFDGTHTVEEIEAFAPDVYVRATDRIRIDLHSKELEALRRAGTAIEFIDRLPFYSTTNLIALMESSGSHFHPSNATT
jgi:rfaE bifunctional protein nucleotidyltransferase chain/domain